MYIYIYRYIYIYIYIRYKQICVYIYIHVYTDTYDTDTYRGADTDIDMNGCRHGALPQCCNRMPADDGSDLAQLSHRTASLNAMLHSEAFADQDSVRAPKTT